MAVSVEEHKIVLYICVFYIDLHCFWKNKGIPVKVQQKIYIFNQQK